MSDLEKAIALIKRNREYCTGYEWQAGVDWCLHLLESLRAREKCEINDKKVDDLKKVALEMFLEDMGKPTPFKKKDKVYMERYGYSEPVPE